MENKLNFKLLNLLIIIAIVCLLYWIKGLWLGLVTSLFGIIAPFDKKIKGGKKCRNEAYAERSLELIAEFDIFPET